MPHHRDWQLAVALRLGGEAAGVLGITSQGGGEDVGVVGSVIAAQQGLRTPAGDGQGHDLRRDGPAPQAA